MSYQKSGAYLAGLLSVLFMGVGCVNFNVSVDTTTTTPDLAKPIISTTTPPAPNQDTIDLSPTDVKVVSLGILQLESFPVQVTAYIKGYVAKCVKLGEPKVSKQGNRFLISLDYAVLGTVCKAKNASVSFEKSVKLDAYGLKKGTYSVEVGDMKKEFTLNQDNIQLIDDMDELIKKNGR